MPSRTAKSIIPTALLSDIRREGSLILGRPFTETIDHQVFQPDKRALASWAADCAEQVLAFFNEDQSGDTRPRHAIDACWQWAANGVFRMTGIRKSSPDAHAAFREAYEADAVFAAHATGQRRCNRSCPNTRPLGFLVYAIRAVAAHTGKADDGLIGERIWQLERLRRYAGPHDSR